MKHAQNLIETFKSKKPFGILDLIIIAILIIAIVLCCIFALPTEQGKSVIIYKSGKEIGRYSLTNDRNVELLDGKMLISIENKTCFVKYSDCKNQICVKSKSISKSGERIVCLPNAVSIVVTGENDHYVTGGVL